ncbi:hypothetical protein HOO65_070394 [Ceratocystis lukuohia]|uniref:Uncharacterized protein n=2 Tax=Ceratocystis TaxID=5157 RepID=A0A0F8DFD9_CERFI|nr:hypothetical protein CFO_g2989 [Ceratocystis platani]
MPVRDHSYGQYAGSDRSRYEPWTWTVDEKEGRFWYPRDLGYDPIYKSQVQVFLDAMDLCFVVGVIDCSRQFPGVGLEEPDIPEFHSRALKLFNQSRRLETVDPDVAKKRLDGKASPHLFSSYRHQFAFPQMILEPWEILRRGYLSAVQLTYPPVPQPPLSPHLDYNLPSADETSLNSWLTSWSLMPLPPPEHTGSPSGEAAPLYTFRGHTEKPLKLWTAPVSLPRPEHHPKDYHKYFAEFYNPAVNRYFPIEMPNVPENNVSSPMSRAMGATSESTLMTGSNNSANLTATTGMTSVSYSVSFGDSGMDSESLQFDPNQYEALSGNMSDVDYNYDIDSDDEAFEDW